MSGFLELIVNQGATFKAQLELKNDVGEALNLVAYTCTSQIRRSYYSGNVTANVTCTKLDATNGVLQLSVDSNTTANINSGRYVFDVIATNSDETVRLVEGLVTITPRTTR